LNRSNPSILFKYQAKLNIDHFSETVARETKEYLKDQDTYFRNKRAAAMMERENIYQELVQLLGSKEAVLELEREYNNSSLADLVLNRREIIKIVEKNSRLIRKSMPIYMIPTAVNGRAHFYASVKRIGNLTIKTLTFNILVIWLSHSFYISSCILT
jgi:hypothetical protein